MAPGASSTNDRFRAYYAPRAPEPLTKHRQQPTAPFQHPKPQRPVRPHNAYGSANRAQPDDDDQQEPGCFGEINKYKAGDEFVLLWKWVDEFMDKRRAKKSPSKSHNTDNPSSRQTRPTPSPSREVRRVPQQAGHPSQGAVRSNTIGREDIREYRTPPHSPWGERLYLFKTRKNRQAKKAGQAGARSRDESTRRQATEGRDEPTRGRPTNRPPRPNRSPPAQDRTGGSQSGTGRTPNPAYHKTKGEVQKHTVTIAQPPIHNSMHLEHTPSNNYRARPSPSRGRKDKSSRDTRFSNFFHHRERHAAPPQEPAPTRETQRTSAAPGGEDGSTLNRRYSSVLDPAKAVKKLKDAERAKGPKCYICGARNCHGGYRDSITDLWACAACQKENKLGPVQCSVCGQPNSPATGYARNGLWMCTACQNPTTPKELPPSPKFATSAPKASRPPIPQGVDEATGERPEFRACSCPDCHQLLTPFPVIPPKSPLRPNGRDPLSEYDSDHLYSDDSYETRDTTPPQNHIGLGLTFPNDAEEEWEEEEEEERYRPTPPLKDSRYFQDSPTLPAQSYIRPHAPMTTPRKASTTFAAPKNPYTTTKKKEERRQKRQPATETRYPYPSPPSSPTALHKPRPASSIYPTDEPTTAIDFPYPPPPIPQPFARSSSASPGMRSRASVGSKGARTVLNRRSSWYDFWKPVFEKAGEKSP